MNAPTNETTQDAGQEAGVENGAEDAVTETAAPEAMPPAGDDRYLFPHEAPGGHWEADFGDSKQVYEGTALPIWLLAGWAIFILWAVVYLLFGLPTAF